MRALVWGVDPQPWDVPDDANPLVKNLANTPMQLLDVADPEPIGPDWVVARTRMCGICGSDAKQVWADFTIEEADNALGGFVSFPQVLGHEVVAEVRELGPEAEGLEQGQRVVLNPWLSCGPRGIDPPCPACESGDYSLCWNFLGGRLSPGIHTGNAKEATGGYADFVPAHDSMWIPVPDSVPDELAVLADPFSVSLHSVTRHPPPPGGKALVYGAGALGTCAIAILRALHPDVEVAVVARFEGQAEMARRLGAAAVVPHDPRQLVLEELAAWSGGVLHKPLMGLPMAHPGGIDVVYDTVGKPETFEVGVRLLKARGTLVKSGVHAPGRWEWSPLYFKEISWVGSNAFGVEEVDGVRQHGIHHYLDLVSSGRVDMTGMLTHTFPLEQWRQAFTTLAEQDRTGAIKVAFDFRD